MKVQDGYHWNYINNLPLLQGFGCSDEFVVTLDIKDSEASIKIQLTKPDCPSFLYSLDLTESQFNKLKDELNLTKSFTDFPAWFIDLLKECSCPAKNYYVLFPHDQATISQTPRSTTSDGSNIVMFDLIRKLEFGLCYVLKLTFKQASANELNTYLVEWVATLKDQQASNERENYRLQEQLSRRNEEIETIKNDFQSREHQFKQQMHRAKEEHDQMVSNLKSRHSDEKRKLNQECDKKCKELEKRFIESELAHTNLQSEYETCMAELNTEKSLIDELNGKIEILEGERDQFEDDIERLEHENGELCDQFDNVAYKLDNHDSIVNDRDSTIVQLKDENVSLFQEKEILAEKLKQRKAYCEQIKSSLNDLVLEKKKWKEVISTVQSKRQLSYEVQLNMRSRLDEKEDAYRKQYEAVQNLTTENDKLSTEVQEQKLKIQHFEDDLNRTKTYVEKLETEVQTKAEVNVYLREQLNLRGGYVKGGAMSTVIPSFPSSSDVPFRPLHNNMGNTAMGATTVVPGFSTYRSVLGSNTKGSLTSAGVGSVANTVMRAGHANENTPPGVIEVRDYLEPNSPSTRMVSTVNQTLTQIGSSSVNRYSRPGVSQPEVAISGSSSSLGKPV